MTIGGTPAGYLAKLEVPRTTHNAKTRKATRRILVRYVARDLDGNELVRTPIRADAVAAIEQAFGS